MWFGVWFASPFKVLISRMPHRVSVSFETRTTVAEFDRKTCIHTYISGHCPTTDRWCTTATLPIRVRHPSVQYIGLVHVDRSFALFLLYRMVVFCI